MATHVRILGILHIVLGSIGILIGFGLSLLLGLVLARKMVTPIRALQASAAQIGAGALDQRIEIPLDASAKAKIGEGTVLAVTLEQKGGSPTGVAQGPIVAVGTATPI